MMNATCNGHCRCDTGSYEPVCGVDRVQYFSACHAGCISAIENGDSKKYGNCSCIIPPSAQNYSVVAESGNCAPSCGNLPVFLVFFFFTILTTFVIQVPGAVVSLRCIPDSQRAFGFGIKWLFIRALGTVPGPVLFGAIFDAACTVWQDKCDTRGSCWIYSRVDLSYYVFAMVICVKLSSALFFFLAQCCYKAPKEEAEEITMENKGETNRAFDTSEVNGAPPIVNVKPGGVPGTGYMAYVNPQFSIPPAECYSTDL